LVHRGAENADLLKELFDDTIPKHDVLRGQLTVHADSDAFTHPSKCRSSIKATVANNIQPKTLSGAIVA